MRAKLLTEHHLEFLSLKGGCTGSSESTLVNMPHCWKLHVVAHMKKITHLTKPTIRNTLKEQFGLGLHCFQRTEYTTGLDKQKFLA